MQDVTCTITGNAVADVRTATTASGHLRAWFRMAATPRRFDQASGRFVDRDTTWVTVVCWRQIAENVAQSVRKGDPVVVVGRLRVRDWVDGDRTGTTVEIDATSVGHDLARGTSRFERVRRLSPAESDERLPGQLSAEVPAPDQVLSAGAGGQSERREDAA